MITASPSTSPSSHLDLTDAPRDRASAKTSSRWFHVGVSVAALITLLIGFAPSFYLRPSSSPRLEPRVVVHGILFTSWIVLYVVQTLLVATGHRTLHRRLGIAGAVLAAVAVVWAAPMAVALARRGQPAGDPLVFMLVIWFDLALFAVFVSAAIHARRRSETHKRLMLLALVSILPPGISRWPIAVGRPQVIFLVLLPFLLAPLARDLLARRRPHPASVWGGLAVALSGPVRFAVASTATWHHIAAWLIR
jgi:hypothetical protein